MKVKVFERSWLVAAALGWSGVLAGGCDAERDDSVFDCDPATQACGAGDSSEDPGQDQDQGQDQDPADEDDDDACVGEACDPGQPDPDPEPEPDDGDPRGDDDGSGGTCEDQYDACVGGGVTPEACEVQREACETPRGEDDDPNCALVEFGGPGGEDEQQIWLRCYDSLDADCDGLVDCEDPDCDFVCNPGGDTSGDDQTGDHCYQTPEVDECYGCTCVPGSVRDCHVPGPCTWGKSTCLDDGTWGDCLDTGDVPPACDLGGGSPYDVGCCVDAGRCCENLDYDYSLYDETQGAHASVGNCGEVCATPPG